MGYKKSTETVDHPFCHHFTIILISFTHTLDGIRTRVYHPQDLRNFLGLRSGRVGRLLRLMPWFCEIRAPSMPWWWTRTDFQPGCSGSLVGSGFYEVQMMLACVVFPVWECSKEMEKSNPTKIHQNTVISHVFCFWSFWRLLWSVVWFHDMR